MGHKRRQFRETEVLECLLMQGAVIPCFRCRVAITMADVTAKNVQKEHLHERSLNGPDEPGNCRFSHADCHAVITYGNGATTAGSSANRIAKATEPRRIEKFRVNKRPIDADLVSQPTRRCPRCGEYPDGCSCVSHARRSSFGGRR